MTTLNRETLLRATTLLRPALSTAQYVPVFTHIRFDGKTAAAYNDVTAIEVTLEADDLDCCIPGELLIKTLGSFGGDTVTVKDAEEGSVLLSSGRSKMKIPVLETGKFPDPFATPIKQPDVIELDRSILAGIDACLMSVGTDPTHAAQMGVTLEADDDGRAVLFSTDNFTISRYQTNTKIKLQSPVILPTFFCQQLIALAKAFPDDELDLEVGTSAILATVGKSAKLFSKLIVDLEALDFESKMSRIISRDKIKKGSEELPTQWDAALNRALLVLSGEADKVTTLSMGRGGIVLKSSSSMGEAEDVCSFESTDMISEPVLVDPSLLVRGSKPCANILITDKVTALSDERGQFIHLIAHCSK
jgi:DNA polymerase III sliding clamp (beta) subunit (PCNA family)